VPLFRQLSPTSRAAPGGRRRRDTLFQDVYPWAGRFRTVRIAKGDSMFCYSLDRRPAVLDAGAKPLVNWDVVDSSVEALRTRLNEGWQKLNS
jgi:hypothetical protein